MPSLSPPFCFYLLCANLGHAIEDLRANRFGPLLWGLLRNYIVLGCANLLIFFIFEAYANGLQNVRGRQNITLGGVYRRLDAVR